MESDSLHTEPRKQFSNFEMLFKNILDWSVLLLKLTLETM